MILIFLRRVYRRLNRIFQKNHEVAYDFNKSNPLGGNGERVDFMYTNAIDVDRLDIYQQNHFRRYEFAVKHISQEAVCGDFACGTGYGSIMLGEKALRVVGVDINKKVISEIRKRYRRNTNVDFRTLNLLNLDYDGVFDVIVSFETIEHIDEADITRLLNLYNKALKKDGKIIFSTPYMQENSEAARKLGFHKTFHINEGTIRGWLDSTGFKIAQTYFQNYETHKVVAELQNKECIVCIAEKIN